MSVDDDSVACTTPLRFSRDVSIDINTVPGFLMACTQQNGDTDGR
jgi:hypothetical protein